jgi:localization factor PodJL
MARAIPASQPDYPGDPQRDEWQALRGELVALLDQVESRVAQTSQQPSPQVTQRMQDLRQQVAAAPPANRHRDALRSVQQAVNRFNVRDEAPANPRDTLEAAIREIRARQANRSDPVRHQQSPPAPSPAPAPVSSEFASRFDELARAVSGVSGRLERLEADLKSQLHDAGTIRDIAEQLGQLTQVVELLSGAVGETGQVKRLEAQIAGLANLIAERRDVDLSSLTQRLDDVSATVERLADLQVQHVSRERELPAEQAAMKKGMAAIEKSVRTVYDRIDTIEKNVSLAPEDFERLTSEMAHFTEEMKSAAQPQGLIRLVEDLTLKVADMDGRERDVTGLQTDLLSLREAVLGAMEPRFAALESQLEELNERVASRPADNSPSVGQLEAQVRQLVARMDQTGEQLTDLANLYTQPQIAEVPDFDTLADMVASRTSEALQRIEPAAAANSTISDDSIQRLEERVSRLLATSPPAASSDDLSDVQDGIRRVDERLERLEAALGKLNTEQRGWEERPEAIMPSAPPPATFAAPATSSYTPAYAPTPFLPETDFEAEEVVDEEPAYEPPAYTTGRGDNMPISPAVERPLIEKPFPSPDIRGALDAKNGPRMRHPGLHDDEEPPDFSEMSPLTPEMLGGARPRASEPVSPDDRQPFDPSKATLPPRPVSPFDTEEPESFTTPPPEAFSASPAAEPDEPEFPAPAVTTSSRNTFMEAQRRAAQRHNPPTSVGAGSLLGRAMARFQAGKEIDEQEKVEADAPKVSRWKRRKAEPRVEAPVAAETAPPAPDDDDQIEIDEIEKKESFLSRHRKPILLAASIVALAFLTINLINQRMSQQAAPAAESEAPAETSAIEAPAALVEDSAPIAETAELSGPRVIPMVDSLAAGVDPIVTANFAPSPTRAAGAAMPPALGTDAFQSTSPVKVDLPPDTIGPIALRQAAANGDPRAQFEVAAIYTEGKVLPADLKLAGVWYERSAAQGFAPAQYRLGNLYENGQGLVKDLEQARLWYQRAAEAGNRMSMHNLAALYASGNLGKQEFASAAEWFEQAAGRGMTDSQFNLGMLYARGLGVEQDLESSYRWFALAARSGDQDAAKARDDIARSLAADVLKQLNDELAKWKPVTIDIPANFAPIGTWSATFDPGPVVKETDVVLGVQTLLQRLGFDVGNPDGVAGPKTAEAIRAFEKATGMSESGQINPRLLAVLSSQPV